MTKEFFEKIYEAAETEAKNCGAEYCEVYYVGAEGISANTFRDELAGFSADCDGSLIVRVSVGGKAGGCTGESCHARRSGAAGEKSGGKCRVDRKRGRSGLLCRRSELPSGGHSPVFHAFGGRGEGYRHGTAPCGVRFLS